MFKLWLSLSGAASEFEQQLSLARRQLLSLGVPLFPDGMLLQVLEDAPLLGSGTFGTCYMVQVYSHSCLVNGAAKVFHKKTHLHLLLNEATTYLSLGDVPRVPGLLGVSLVPLCLVTTMHGPTTLLDAALQAATPALQLLHALDQVAATLQVMHHRGLVHNDVKFDNVLLDRAPGPPCTAATLVDMGAVRAAGCRPYCGRALSASKYPYLAPEVVGGGPVSPASDAYSLGWMLQGVVARLPDPRGVVQGVGVARQCMHHDPQQRLTVSGFRHGITELLLSTQRFLATGGVADNIPSML